MSDHTPGPWGWTYDGSKDYTVGEADDPQAKPVAHVYAWQRNYDKAAANCALIAAAPELQAKLKEALGALADIALAPDLTETQRRAKALRVYKKLKEKQ